MPKLFHIPQLKGSAVCCKDKTGVFLGTTIQCDCCRFEFSPSKWERHAGSTRHRPWQTICISETGKNLLYYKQKYDPVPPKLAKTKIQVTDPVASIFGAFLSQGMLKLPPLNTGKGEGDLLPPLKKFKEESSTSSPSHSATESSAPSSPSPSSERDPDEFEVAMYLFNMKNAISH